MLGYFRFFFGMMMRFALKIKRNNTIKNPIKAWCLLLELSIEFSVGNLLRREKRNLDFRQAQEEIFPSAGRNFFLRHLYSLRMVEG